MGASARVFLATLGSMGRVHNAVNGRRMGMGMGEDEDGVEESPYTRAGESTYHFIIDEASTVPQFEVRTLGIIGDVETPI